MVSCLSSIHFSQYPVFPNEFGVETFYELIAEHDDSKFSEEEFVGETTMYIPQNGDYELYIYTESGIVLTGEFSVN